MGEGNGLCECSESREDRMSHVYYLYVQLLTCHLVDGTPGQHDDTYSTFSSCVNSGPAE